MLVLHGGSEGYHAPSSQPAHQRLVLLTVQKSFYTPGGQGAEREGMKLVMRDQTSRDLQSCISLYVLYLFSTMMESLTELLQWLLDAIIEALYMDPQRSPLNLHFVSDEIQV